MKTLTSFFRPALLMAALPAALVFSACGDDDDPVAAPDQGRVLVVHAAAAVTSPITPFINDVQLGQALNYGANSGYTVTGAGTPTVRINNGTQLVDSEVITVAKDQNYSVFAYSPNATIGSADLLSVQDDLTAPAALQAKVRVVHLAVGAPTPVRLTVPSAVPGGAGTDITPDVAFGTASSFAAINAGTPMLAITGGTPRTVVLNVGDGSGSGTGTKTYEAGKIYTIVVRGITGAGVPTAQQPQAFIIQNN